MGESVSFSAFFASLSMISFRIAWKVEACVPCAICGTMMSKEIEQAFADPTRHYGVPLIYDLNTDPKEATPLVSNWYHSGRIRWPAGKYVVEHAVSLKKEPPIRPGTPDPYMPGR